LVNGPDEVMKLASCRARFAVEKSLRERRELWWPLVDVNAQDVPAQRVHRSIQDRQATAVVGARYLFTGRGIVGQGTMISTREGVTASPARQRNKAKVEKLNRVIGHRLERHPVRSRSKRGI
jgi:hypothetical protein